MWFFFLTDILTGVTRYLIVVLFGISMITDAVEQFFQLFINCLYMFIWKESNLTYYWFLFWFIFSCYWNFCSSYFSYLHLVNRIVCNYLLLLLWCLFTLVPVSFVWQILLFYVPAFTLIAEFLVSSPKPHYPVQSHTLYFILSVL